MLAKPFKDGEKHIKYPLYIQPKLDGVRCITFLQKPDSSPQHVIMYSRTKKDFPSLDYLKEILYPYLNKLFDKEKKQSIFLDGELYKHGKKLQDISGDSRNSKVKSNKNEYHLYDCFYPLELDTNFATRHKQMEKIFEAINADAKAADKEDAKNNTAKYIKMVETKLIKDSKEQQKEFDHFIKNGYEGAILRNSKGYYLSDQHKTGSFLRSKDLVKMKKKETDEFEVVGFTEGKRGKDIGAIIWQCITPNGYEFNITPKDMTYEERYKLFKKAKKNFAQFKGRMLTVEYEDLSKNGVPQRAKGLVFRDYE